MKREGNREFQKGKPESDTRSSENGLICAICDNQLFPFFSFMSTDLLNKVLERCQNIEKFNHTEEAFQKVKAFLNKNLGKLVEEAKIARSDKRRTYGNYESQLSNLFIELCNYRCTQQNRDNVNKIMSDIGYEGYKSKPRFRQRMENYLKNEKKKRRPVRGLSRRKRAQPSSDVGVPPEVEVPPKRTRSSSNESDIKEGAMLLSGLGESLPLSSTQKYPSTLYIDYSFPGQELSPHPFSFATPEESVFNEEYMLHIKDNPNYYLNDKLINSYDDFDTDKDSLLLSCDYFEDMKKKGVLTWDENSKSSELRRMAMEYMDDNKDSGLPREPTNDDGNANEPDPCAMGSFNFDFFDPFSNVCLNTWFRPS